MATAKRTVLVTGGAGFIGSNFVRALLTTGRYKVVNLDKLTYAGNLRNLQDLPHPRDHVFVRGDIADPKTVRPLFERYRVSAVVNLAAETHVDRSITNPEDFVRTNVVGTEVLLRCAKEAWFRNGRWRPEVKFVQVSTDEVYGSLGPRGRFKETTPLDPHSPYSASKAGADLLVKAFHDTYGLPACITRCSNNYGPYQLPEKLIPLMILNASRHEPLPVYGDGRNVRDWIHVSDHCTAVRLVLEHGRPGRVYNIGADNEHRNIDLVRTVIRLVRELSGDPQVTERLIRFVKDRPGHDRRYAIDASLIRRELGWRPAIPFDQGLRDTVRWYLEHPDWVRSCLSGEYRRFYDLNYRKR